MVSVLDALLASIIVLAVVALIYLSRRLTAAKNEQARLAARFRGIIDADAERLRVLAQLAEERNAAVGELKAFTEAAESQRRASETELAGLDAELTELTQQRNALQAEVSLLDEEATLQSFGVYKPHYSLATSALYAQRLDKVREQQKAMVKNKTAAVGTIEWTVNGSKREGQKSINQTLKLMLRAFNGECDAAVAKVRYNNVQVMEARIEKAFEVLNSLASVQACVISRNYLALKLDELHLAHEYEEKRQEEKEEQRRIREQMREEEVARREIERARESAEKDAERAAAALAKARQEVADAVGAKQAKLQGQIVELERRLAEAQANKERAISRAQQTRSGHVYVISNIGSFGEHVYKIGMTRRLDPMERIWELGDASVPFDFDVHAVIYTDDAPALENALHKTFHAYRINRINERKEFFHVTIDAIAAAVREQKADVRITLAAEAADYWKSQAILAEEQRAGLQVSTLQRFSVPIQRNALAAQSGASAFKSPASISSESIEPQLPGGKQLPA